MIFFKADVFSCEPLHQSAGPLLGETGHFLIDSFVSISKLKF